jgi:K+-transporting ATPase ATPase C chain
MLTQLRPAIVLFALLAIITGLIYPFVITGVAQTVFPRQANGSLIYRNGQPVGSALIGQPFDDPKYFWGRLSATSLFPYNAVASSGSNYGLDALRAADPGNTAPIPVDLVTASASGLDPHISIAAAMYQASRVARVRGLGVEQVQALIRQYTEPRQFGVLGEPRVNVLKLNFALDGVK